MILFVTATEFELSNLLNHYFSRVSNNLWELNKSNNIWVLVSGVGMVQTAIRLTKLLTNSQFDMAIQVGLAGSFDNNLEIGELVYVCKDNFAEIGVLAKGGSIKSFSFPYRLDNIDQTLYHHSICPFNKCGLEKNFSKHVIGVTVNSCTAIDSRARFFIKKFNAQVETMEGAAFYCVCNEFSIPSMQIRSISNYINSKNKLWEIEKSLKNIEQFVYDLLIKFSSS